MTEGVGDAVNTEWPEDCGVEEADKGDACRVGVTGAVRALAAPARVVTMVSTSESLESSSADMECRFNPIDNLSHLLSGGLYIHQHRAATTDNKSEVVRKLQASYAPEGA